MPPRALLCRGRSDSFTPAKPEEMLSEINADTAERGNRIMAIFHFTVKIVRLDKGKSIISASAYLNGDVMKNEETGRIGYYNQKEVVYTSLMMCEMHILNGCMYRKKYKGFNSLSVIKERMIKMSHWRKFKITFQKQRLWNEVLKIEKMQMHVR